VPALLLLCLYGEKVLFGEKNVKDKEGIRGRKRTVPGEIKCQWQTFDQTKRNK